MSAHQAAADILGLLNTPLFDPDAVVDSTGRVDNGLLYEYAEAARDRGFSSGEIRILTVASAILRSRFDLITCDNFVEVDDHTGNVMRRAVFVTHFERDPAPV